MDKMKVAAQLISIFQVEKSDTIHPIFIKFSPIWARCGWRSNACNRWTVKFRSWSKFTTILIFKCEYFIKNLQGQISLMITGNYKIPGGMRFRHLHGQWPRSLFSKILLRFPHFTVRVENTVLWSSEITQHFQHHHFKIIRQLSMQSERESV